MLLARTCGSTVDHDDIPKPTFKMFGILSHNYYDTLSHSLASN